MVARPRRWSAAGQRSEWLISSVATAFTQSGRGNLVVCSHRKTLENMILNKVLLLLCYYKRYYRILELIFSFFKGQCNLYFRLILKLRTFWKNDVRSNCWMWVIVSLLAQLTCSGVMPLIRLGVSVVGNICFGDIVCIFMCCNQSWTSKYCEFANVANM